MMTLLFNRTNLLCVLLCIGIVSESTSLNAEDSEFQKIVTKVRSDWKKRRLKADSMLYDLSVDANYATGRCFFCGEELVRSYKCSAELVLDFKRNRVRRTIDKAIWHHKKQRFFLERSTDGFDGKQYIEFVSHKATSIERWSVAIKAVRKQINKNIEEFIFHEMEYPLLLAHGVFPAEVLFVSGGVEYVHFTDRICVNPVEIEYKGLPCIKFQINNLTKEHDYYFELIVDPNKDGAVLCWRKCLRGVEDWYDEIEIENEKTQKGWMPVSWERKNATTINKPDVKKVVVKSRLWAPRVTNSVFDFEADGLLIGRSETGAAFIKSKSMMSEIKNPPILLRRNNSWCGTPRLLQRIESEYESTRAPIIIRLLRTVNSFLLSPVLKILLPLLVIFVLVKIKRKQK